MLELFGGSSTKCTWIVWVRNGSSPGPTRHQVRDFAESPEWAALSPVSTTTSSSRTRGAASCRVRNSPSPYVSEVIPRTNTRPFFAMLARFPAPGAVALSGSEVSRYAAILGLTDRPIQTARSVMGVLRLSIATTDYDHFRDFRLGTVRAEGIEHVWSVLGHHEVFARFTAHREWDVAELSIAKFAAQVTRDEPDIVGLPVVCSRVFRFGAFYLNRRSGIETAEDLRGKRIGSPEWAHSAAVYMRGWLHNEVGVKLDQVEWYQAGANSPGREEKVELSLPDGVRLTRVSDRSLSDLLAAGDIDCALIARPPTCFLRGHPDIVRLYPDFETRELAYYQQTGIWPIMHIIAMQRRILDENPWVARNLYNAFLESKNRSVERLLDPAVSRYPLPWLPAYGRRMADLFGGDPFPYGIEANRATVGQLLGYAHQQGIAHRLATPDEVFPTGIMTKVVV